MGCDNDEFGWGDNPILPGDPTDGIAFIDSGIECWLREQGVLPPIDLINRKIIMLYRTSPISHHIHLSIYKKMV